MSLLGSIFGGGGSSSSSSTTSNQTTTLTDKSVNAGGDNSLALANEAGAVGGYASVGNGGKSVMAGAGSTIYQSDAATVARALDSVDLATNRTVNAAQLFATQANQAQNEVIAASDAAQSNANSLASKAYNEIGRAHV